MLCLKDEKLADRLGYRFKSGIQAIPKFIDGKMSNFFPVEHQPPVKFKSKTIGKVIFIGEDQTIGIEMLDNKGFNYMFNQKYRKYITI